MFLDGGVNRFLLSPRPASQQLSVLHFVFITGFRLQSFISAGAATHRTQSSIAKYDRDLS